MQKTKIAIMKKLSYILLPVRYSWSENTCSRQVHALTASSSQSDSFIHWHQLNSMRMELQTRDGEQEWTPNIQTGTHLSKDMTNVQHPNHTRMHMYWCVSQPFFVLYSQHHR